MDPAIVAIDSEAIDKLLIPREHANPPREEPPEQTTSARDIIQFALAINSINHQFWDVVDGRFVRYAHQGQVGAMAMMAGLRALLRQSGSMDAIAGKLPIEAEEIERFFGPIPNPEERALALGQALGPRGLAAATMLEESCNGRTNWSIGHAAEIAELLPAGFEDPFLKKAQLALWMAKGFLSSRSLGDPRLDLSCFADYQIPKVLRGLGVLRYNDELGSQVDSGRLLEPDGPCEIAIRAASVIACEEISEKKNIGAPELDFWLWSRRNDFKAPFHLVRTRKY